eukprot:TRINITY_DN19539_c0_g3_i1.p1 TRINITY_DN19539_c0_g3~~TRINITY_DN19539_c0_g3_i1.p1  ORF type:complete len:128 (-),score=8.82 TRINITY_DN19539_c0_g3_i1:173-556(-)
MTGGDRDRAMPYAATTFIGCTAMGTRQQVPPTIYSSPTAKNSPVADKPFIMIMPNARGRSVPRSPMLPAHSILLKLIFIALSLTYFTEYKEVTDSAHDAQLQSVDLGGPLKDNPQQSGTFPDFRSQQ